MRSTFSVAVQGLALLVACMLAAGCAGSSDEDETMAPSGNSSSSGTPAGTPNGVTDPTDDLSSLPVPTGARGWPVREVASCAELTDLQEPRLVVRVPVADGHCLVHAPATSILVIVTREIVTFRDSGRAISIPGFSGTATALMEQMNRAGLVIVKPASETAQYLIVLQGDAPPPDETVRDLFGAG